MRQRRRESRRVRGLWGQLDFARSWALNASRSRTAASSLSGLILYLCTPQINDETAGMTKKTPANLPPGGAPFFCFFI